MKLHELNPVQSSKDRKRVGRGVGSGMGKTSTHGANGQNARTGGGVRLGFEGGQTPLFKRLPKRGFKNINRKEYAIVNVADLEMFDNGTVVTVELLQEAGLVKDILSGVKVLANGELTKSLTVKAHKISASAQQKIEAAGGTVEVM